MPGHKAGHDEGDVDRLILLMIAIRKFEFLFLFYYRDVISSELTCLEWREIRNVLSHRAAPGRTFFVGIGGPDGLPDQCKIKNIMLDADMAPARRAQLANLLNKFVAAIDDFSSARL
jgi:hypothetical protein